MTIDGALCGDGLREVRRDPHGGPRWCFACRKVCTFTFVLRAPAGMSYYGPAPHVECDGCGATDGDMFPGRYRTWE